MRYETTQHFKYIPTEAARQGERIHSMPVILAASTGTAALMMLIAAVAYLG